MRASPISLEYCCAVSRCATLWPCGLTQLPDRRVAAQEAERPSRAPSVRFATDWPHVGQGVRGTPSRTSSTSTGKAGEASRRGQASRERRGELHQEEAGHGPESRHGGAGVSRAGTRRRVARSTPAGHAGRHAPPADGRGPGVDPRRSPTKTPSCTAKTRPGAVSTTGGFRPSASS